LAQVKVYYNRKGETLTVWFGNPFDVILSEAKNLKFWPKNLFALQNGPTL
jgi:hypothetical protein